MKLRIAEIGPLWYSIPPTGYGGTERVLYSLVEGLHAKGHDVTFFGCGTSKVSSKIISVYPRPLAEDNYPWTSIHYPLLNITAAFDRADEFDIIHMHLNKSSDYLALPLAKPIAKKVVFTLHFPYPLSQNRQDRHEVLQKYKDLQFVSISNAARRQGENLNWVATVYNGIDLQDYTFNKTPKDYYLWLGKFNPDKGVTEAIMAAKKANVKLVLAGKVDPVEVEDYEYYQNEVKPLIDGKQIVYVGEVGGKKKDELYGGAIAFLNPIQWNEPFGLVMAESMATGTPVISFNNGAAPEVIQDGKTGFIVNTLDEMVSKIPAVTSLSRRDCRTRVEQHFSNETMVANYERVFERMVQ